MPADEHLPGPRGGRRRLLVALPLGGGPAAEVDGLRRSLGSSALGRIAPHVTLIPPLNVAEEDIGEAMALVRSVAGADAIEATLGPVETFAPRNPVVYLAVNGAAAAIDRVRRMLTRPPLSPPARRAERPFVPHVTLSSEVSPAALTNALAVLSRFHLDVSLALATCYEQERGGRHGWSPLADVLLGSEATVGRGGRELTFSAATISPPSISWAPPAAVSYPDGAGLVVIAAESRSPVGVADGLVNGDRYVLSRLVVDPGRRREGIGHQLLAEVERVSAWRNLDVVDIVVPDDLADHDAITALAMNSGFRRVDAPWVRGRLAFERLVAASPRR